MSRNKKEVVIAVKNLHKDFILPRGRGNSFKSLLINFRRTYTEIQHTLRGISFNVHKGDFLGVVGRNGSGKSTLLKLLSGIYTPTKGSITVKGKLTPFIELGVGFNPELSGRDNVYLNGALLGFSRAEMGEKYDEIVAFSELERFMDQKLKNYSSGMQVRLAFSIAIQTNTDILVLDEVLAVGDEAFQRKCFDYFKQIKAQKKTVILVTHDMASVRRFCNRAIMIDNGKVVADGQPEEVANLYSLENIEKAVLTKKTATNKPWISVAVDKKILTPQDTLRATVEYYVPSNQSVSFGISVIDEASNRATSVIDDGFFRGNDDVTITSQKKGVYKYHYRLPLDEFNNRTFEIAATLFAYDSKRDEYEPIAYTTEKQIATFYVKSKNKDGGLLKRKGEWQKVK
ncbi:ABC transporter ATP-binding protein [TM7 phylum sp. oral taxon 349]|nr:ABC transporter ATP-binding protein [TM7 phylum sp. oral taxon 349]